MFPSPACIPLGMGVEWGWAGHILYRGSSWDPSNSFRSRTGNYVYKGYNVCQGVVRAMANWRLRTPLQIFKFNLFLNTAVKKQINKQTNTSTILQQCYMQRVQIYQSFHEQGDLAFSSHSTEGDQRQPVTYLRAHSMSVAEPSSGLLVQCPPIRLGCLLLLFARNALKDLGQVPCPLWASVSLSVTHGSRT